MQLSDFFPTEQILRDCEFDALGLSNSQYEGRLLSFLDSPRYIGELLANPAVRAVLCTAVAESQLPASMGVVICENPRRAYFELHNQLAQSPDYCPPLTPSVIPQSCRISPLSEIAPMGVVLGENVTVDAFVSIHGPCRIGDNSVLHTGAKIGGAGYEFKYFGDEVLDVTHCGSVEIGSGVIIWENTTIHKAVYPWDVTRIGEGSRVGAQSHIDHGVKIGAFSKICAGAIISGRTEIGPHAYIGPGAVLSNRLHVGAGSHAALGSVVTRDVPAGETVSGNFAVDHAKHIEWLKKIR